MATFHLDLLEATKQLKPIAVASGASLWIAYGDRTGLHLWTYDGSTWSREQLDTEECAEVALAIGAAGLTVVAELRTNDETISQLRAYAKKAGTWSSKDLAGMKWKWSAPAWALASNGEHRALVVGGKHSKLLIGTSWKERATWKSDDIGGAAVAIDGRGQVHVTTANNQHLEYRVFGAKGDAKPEQLGERYMTDHTSIAVAPSGEVAIGVMGGTNSNDRATIFTRTKGEWTTTEPDKNGNNGFDLVLAFDRDGVLHGAWRTETSRNGGSSRTVQAMPVRYGRRGAKAWEVSEVMVAGSPSAFALGEGGRLWIVAGTYPAGAIRLANDQKPTRAASEQPAAPKGGWGVQLHAKLDAIIPTKKYIKVTSPDGKKFFEATIDGTTYVERAGKVGEAGKEVRKAYPKEKPALAKVKSRALDYLLKQWTLVD